MNLIEQLGGYEKAKKELELKEQNSVLQCCIAVTAEMIREALLQYRKEHNIFEYGDDIVYKYEYNRYGLYVIHGRVSDGMVWIRNHRNQFTHEKVGYLEHATPEEIQAGKRL